MKALPVSIASNSFYRMHAQGRVNLFGVLEFLSTRYRVSHADIWSGMLASLEDGYLRLVRQELDRRDLTLANLCVDGPHLWEDDPGLRAWHREKALEYIAAAGVLGARTVRIDMGCRDEGLSPEAFDYICSTYQEYAGMSHGLGMRVGPENHWGASRVPEILRRVQAAVNHPGYGHLLHVLNFAGDGMEGVEAVLPHAMHVHAGIHGMPHLKPVLKRLLESGYAGAVSVENYTGEHELECMEWQLGAVREILAETASDGADGASQKGFLHDIYHQAFEGEGNR